MPSSKLKNSMLVDIAGSKLTGAMPAIDGSALTGISGFMKNASDPATDTNPSGGVGTGWVNTSDGGGGGGAGAGAAWGCDSALRSRLLHVCMNNVAAAALMASGDDLSMV